MMAALMLRNLIPKPNYSIIDTFLEQTISIFKGLGFRVGECGFLWGCGPVGLRLGFSYGGMGGSMVWVLQVGPGLGSSYGSVGGV